MSEGDVTLKSIKVNIHDVLWQTNRQAVEQEMKEMLDVTIVNLADRRCFAARTAASRRVLEKMTERERAQIDADVESRKAQGNPPNVQRERAEKHGDKHVKEWAKQQWLDMGMAAVIFTVHTDRQGRLVANVCVIGFGHIFGSELIHLYRHDDISSLCNLPGQTFSQRYADEVEALQRCVLTFLKSKKPAPAPAPAPEPGQADENAGAGTGAGPEDILDLKMTEDGFPIIPNEISSNTRTKKQNVVVMRKFLSQHYCKSVLVSRWLAN
jgi:hypothetical protein